DGVDERVDGYAHQDDARHVQTRAFEHQQAREHGRRQITEPRNQPENRVEPEPDARARNTKGVVQQRGVATQICQSNHIPALYSLAPYAMTVFRSTYMARATKSREKAPSPSVAVV